MRSIKESLADTSGSTAESEEKTARLSIYDGVCQNCYGSGYFDGIYGQDLSIDEINFCTCPAGESCRKSRQEEINRKKTQKLAGGYDAAGVPPKYRKFPLSSFDDNSHAVAAAKVIAIGGMVHGKKSIFLYGENGSRKTSLGCAILAERIAAGDSCLFVRGSRILDEVQATYSGGQSKVEVLDKYRRSPWLMIDELIEGFVAKELTPDKIGILSEIISERYDWELPTIITSNLTLDSLSSLLKTPKLTDRVFETYAVCEMSGNFRL